MSHCFANFAPDGLCVGITCSPVPMPWPHPVDAGTQADDIYLVDDVICPRTPITITTDRLIYCCDGTDTPAFDGVPADARLIALELEGGAFILHEPALISVQATGKYRSNTLTLRFDTAEQYRREFTEQVDRVAGEKRSAYLTDTPGQAAVYAAKLAEARAFLAGTEDPLFYVSSSEQAMAIIARADACNAALANIEVARLSAKDAIRAASSIPAMKTAAAIDWSTLSEFA